MIKFDYSPRRIKLIIVFIILFSGILLARLYYIQIVQHDYFTERADHQYVSKDLTIFNRGSIYFENKDGSVFGAAGVRSGFGVAIVPKEIKDSGDAAKKIYAVYPLLNIEDFTAKAGKPNDTYEEIARHLDEVTGQKIGSLKIPGVRVFREKWRYYPGNAMASHVVGFVGYKNDVLLGQYGLENYYESVLGRTDANVYSNFFAEMFSSFRDVVNKDKQFQGDIVATIEPNVQNFLEKEIKQISEDYKSRGAGGIIMNPQNGEIYAMAATPSFDPNTYSKEKTMGVFVNPMVESNYEMGSIIKPLTMAAGIDAGTVTPETTYFDTGSVTLNKSTFYNYDKKGRGKVNMQTVLSSSLNTGVAFVVKEMGKDLFAKYMLNYGLGEETGIDLPNETRGFVGNLQSPREIEYATASFGQGISMSPIETVRALASLGNGGLLVNPHIVKRIDYKIGIPRTISYGEMKRVLKPSTSETITKMLVNVVDNALLEGKVKMDHYSIAAKTGTAQVPIIGGNGYYSDRYNHTFFGYFPAYSPKYIVFLYVLEPKGVEYASHSLTYPFIDITKFLINYYNVPPDR